VPEFHAEPYIYLPSVTHKSVLVAWGAFYFRVNSKDRRKLVDDDDLKYVHPPRKDSIGACSAPYGPARVEVYDGNGAMVASAETPATNYCWVAGLAADTEYTYKVFVKGEQWAEGERWDWSAGDKALVQAGGRYDNRFRTHPDPAVPAGSLTFAVIGDFGVGVRKTTDTRRQQQVADALRLAVDAEGVRLVLTTGDNIYAGKTLLGIPVAATGDEDDDWFFTFFQPYRYVINRVPVYPSIGNHDAAESEECDDRAQVEDNFYLIERLSGEEAAGRASSPGCSTAVASDRTSSSCASTPPRRHSSGAAGCSSSRSTGLFSRHRSRRTAVNGCGVFRSPTTRRTAQARCITTHARWRA
jgi:hypothetical protein